MSMRRRQRRRRRLIPRISPARLMLIAILGLIATFIVVMGLFAYMSRDLPAPGKVARSKGFSTVFYDRDGKVLYEMYKDKNRIPISFNDIPDNLKEATLSIEDKDFYTHQGFSIRGMTRAFFNTLVKGKLEGGSTLTQQVVKNVLLTQERTIPRKIKEFVLAVEIERRFTKDEILEMYLNESPYGGTYWGVQSAAQGYFAKDAKELSLVESAILAGLPQRPSYYSPFIGKENAYIGRTKHVLRRMREDGYITAREEIKAQKTLKKISFKSPRFSIIAPHFVFYVKDLIVKEFGEKILDQGLKIRTTISKNIQIEAEKIVAEEIEKVKSLNATNGSLVVLDSKTGEILAMVGSYNYNDDKFGRYNTAIALRQPGSALKPITYAVALEKGYTPSTVIMDLKTEFPDQGGKTYTPVNYDNKFRGPVQLRFALGNSINIPAIKMTAMLGVRTIMQKAYEMGLTSFEPNETNLKRFGLSITLGGGETRLLDLTSAFSVFARGGVRIKPGSIIEVKDRRGKVIYKPPKQNKQRVLSEEISYIISHILSDNNARSGAFGTNSYLRIPGKTVSVKTGTTNDKRDNLTVGYTRDVAVGVWVGNNDNSPMNEKIASGLTGASPIWNRMMRFILKTHDDGIIDKPADVIAIEVDAFLGGLPKEGMPKRSEFFIKGTEPKDISPFYKKLKISKNTGKLANALEIKLGEYEEKEFIIITEKDPVSTDGENRWQKAIDEWASAQEDERFKPPTEISQVKEDEVVVKIKEPEDQKTYEQNTISVKAKITSLDTLEKTEVFVDGSRINLYESDRRTIEEQITLEDGVHVIEVRAKNTSGKTGSSKATIGINKPWDWEKPTVAPSPTDIENTQSPTIFPTSP